MERTILAQLLSMQRDLFHIPFYLYDGEKRLEAFEPSACSCNMISPWLPFLVETGDALAYLLTNDFLLFGRIQDISSGLIIIVGPVRLGSISETILRNIILSGRPVLSSKNLQEIGQFLNSCSSYSLEQFLPVICMIHGFLNNKVITCEDLMKKGMGVILKMIHSCVCCPQRKNIPMKKPCEEIIMNWNQK